MTLGRLYPEVTQRLSKSKYLSGLQCHKRLYLESHSPELATETDEQTQAIMDMGTEVGQLARQRFQGGVLVGFGRYSREEALSRTAELLKDPNVPAIFEGAFEFNDVLAYVDILERVGKKKWRLIEVKAGGAVQDVHLDDLAIQTYILNGAGVSLCGTWLMHLNKEYVYPGGELDLGQLFTIQDVSAEASALQAEVPTRLAAMRAMLAAPSPPAIDPDHHCEAPYPCSFWDHCTKDKPARWVFHLPGQGRRERFEELIRLGVEAIDDIPDGFKLNVIQKRVKENIEWVHPGLKAALKTVRYPVHHLDFETFMPAIPKYQRTRPYQTIPFQWSNHVEGDDGHVEHFEYLCADRRDPREDFAAGLLESVGREGSICAYSPYERTRLNELAEAFPALKRDLDKVVARLWDLHGIIKRNYYHPQFEGSYSLKDVLPAVVPSLHYEDLDIQDGLQASEQYYKMILDVTDPSEKERIRTALLKYCERDTLAMVELRRVLLQKALGR
jgi:predicted RecB family nuclease